jgi:maltooligosyltrehalose trehalohydrolase
MASFEALKLAAGVLLASPCVPLLFMGEEYGEDRPFLYFVDHSDQDLVKAVREGRREQFKASGWEGGEAPDPEGAATFAASRIDWEKRYRGRGKILADYFRRLLVLRREIACLAAPDRDRTEVYGSESDRLVVALRWEEGGSAFWVSHFGATGRPLTIRLPPGRWKKVLDSNDVTWGGPGACLPDRILAVPSDLFIGAWGFALFVMEREEDNYGQRAGA